jgi:hypothetical protein
MLIPELYCQSSDDRIVLVMNRGATKLNAVGALAAHWGLSLSEVAAFGDDYNDIQLLCGCGLGVAGRNAVDEGRAVADAVSGSNDEDGVAAYLERISSRGSWKDDEEGVFWTSTARWPTRVRVEQRPCAARSKGLTPETCTRIDDIRPFMSQGFTWHNPTGIFPPCERRWWRAQVCALFLHL